jgi:DNA mismatch repair protein MSH3
MASNSQNKQQSISSFFTRVPTSSNPAASALKVPLHPSNKAIATQSRRPSSVQSGSDTIPPTVSDEDEPVVTNRRQRQKSQKVFQDKDANAESTDGEDFELPKAKRLRRSTSFSKQLSNSDKDENPQDSERIRVDKAYHTATPDNLKAISDRVRPQILSDRTSKYLFSSSPVREDKNIQDEAEKIRRDKLHEKFVKKLGNPDSIAEIKKRNGYIEDETGGAEGGEEDGDEDQEEEVAAAVKKGKSSIAAKKSRSKLTPMEKQVLEIKRSHMDTVLVVEVGYKFRFFGEDARIAAKELSIVCIPGKFRFDERRFKPPSPVILC